jgi:hypothetical protein
MAVKKARKAEEEAKEHKANEELRRKKGKVRRLPHPAHLPPAELLRTTHGAAGFRTDQRGDETQRSAKGS